MLLSVLFALTTATPTTPAPPIDELFLAAPDAAVGADVDARTAALQAPGAVVDRRNGFVHVDNVGGRRRTVEAAVFLGSGRRLLAVTSQLGCERQSLRVLDIDRAFVDVTASAVPIVMFDEFFEGNGHEPALVDFLLPRHGTSIAVAPTSFCVAGGLTGEMVVAQSMVSILNAQQSAIRLVFDGVGAFKRGAAGGGRHSRSDRVPCLHGQQRAAFVDLPDQRGLLACIEAGSVIVYVVDDAAYRFVGAQFEHGQRAVDVSAHDGHIDAVVALGAGITITDHFGIDDDGAVEIVQQCTVSLQATSAAVRSLLGGAKTTPKLELLDRVHLAALGDADARAVVASTPDVLYPQNKRQRATNANLALVDRVGTRTCDPIP